MKRTKTRKQINLSSSAQRQLNTYAIAAGAVGATGLMLALPAQAEIVYTPAHEVIQFHDIYKLDLANNGTVDFTLQNLGANSTSGHVASLFVSGATGSVEGAASHHGFPAAALNSGATIPSGKFSKKGVLGFVCSGFLDCSRTSSVRGDWINVRDRYLGLKFTIQGETHYAWARLSVGFSGRRGIQGTFAATLTGYAYETIPNQPIVAGDTSGTDERGDASLDNHAPEQATLGLLAMGSPALPMWRREESVVARLETVD